MRSRANRLVSCAIAPTRSRWPLLNLPNTITLVRFGLIPVLAAELSRGQYRAALGLFVLSAVSDVADGLLARLLDQRTRFGAIADPLADKLTMLVVALLLAWQQRLPAWFAAAIVLRDLVIVGGALSYHLWIGRVEMSPTPLSKLNTALEFALLSALLLVAADLYVVGIWLPILLWMTLVTVVLSGAQYVLAWGRKAARQARTRRGIRG